MSFNRSLWFPFLSCVFFSCYLLHCVVLHIVDLVYNGWEFIIICSYHYLQYSQTISSKAGVEFIPMVFCASGLSSFYLYHQTPNITTVIKALPRSYDHSPVQIALYPWYFDSIAQCIFVSLPTTDGWYSFCDHISGLVLHLWEISLWNWRSQLPFLKWFCCYLGTSLHNLW